MTQADQHANRQAMKDRHQKEQAAHRRRATAISAALYHAAQAIPQIGQLPVAHNPIQIRIPLPSVDAVADAARAVGVEPLDTPLRVTATWTYDPVGAAATVEVVWMADKPVEPATWDGRDWIRAGQQSEPGRDDLDQTVVLDVPTYVAGFNPSEHDRTFDLQDTVVFNRDEVA